MDDTYRILAHGRTVSSDTWQTGLNNNDLIIGPSGAGKTRGYVIPNILQCSESMVIADTKGAICPEVGPILAQEGYKVVEINLADCALSPYGYNPLACIRPDREGRYREQDILTLAACMVPVESRHDPYWELTARIYLESAVSYVLEALPEGERHLGSVVRLAGEMGRDGRYKALMRELEVVDPGSFALSRYRLFQSVSESAEKTAACIFSFLASKLAPFSFGDAVRVFTNPERINIKELGRKKTAVFLNISDTDDTAPKAAGKAASAGKETFRAVAKAGAGTYKASFRMLFVQPATSGGCRQKKRKQTAGCGINI
jgi:type IV secretory pathway TraG/TraD family ATPase VirD4